MSVPVAGLERVRLRELLAAATPGPWEFVPATSYRVGGRTRQVGPIVTAAADIAHGGGTAQFRGAPTTEDADAALIVAAVNALPPLLDELDRLTTR